MLVPSKLMSAAYGATARHALASTTTLHAVADLTGSRKATFEATVYPLAIVASKRAPPEVHRIRTTLSTSSHPKVMQSGLRGGQPWIVARSQVRDALAELQQSRSRAADYLECHLGVKTGANRIFLNPPEDLESEMLRWAIRGRDLGAFFWESNTRLLWTHDDLGRSRRELPSRTQAYLSTHDIPLRARKDFKGGPSWVLFRTKPAVAPYRVVWPDLARRLVAVSLTTNKDRAFIPLNSCYVAPMPSAEQADRIAAWLNSSWLGAAARLGAMPAAGGYARFNAQVVSRLPLPAAMLSDARLSRITGEGRAGHAVQEELDDIVAQHLGLSEKTQATLRTVLANTAKHRR